MIGLFKKPELRTVDASKFGLALDEVSGNASGVIVTQDNALRLSAVWTCVRLLTHDISALPVDAFRLHSGARTSIDPKPSWIDEPNPFDPSETGVDHLAQVLLSLLLDGNAFTLALPSVLNATDLHVLNPRTVEIDRDGRGAPTYKVKDSKNNIVGEFSALNIVHVPLWRKPGVARGLSPIEAMSQGIGRGMAAEELGARYFGQGSTFGAVVEYPKDTDPSDADVKDLIRKLNKTHRGVKNAWALGAITGGGQIKELGMKPADAQLIETEEWTLEQVARAYGVPPSLAGSQKPGAVAYASVEQRAIDYVVHGVLPITVRLEKAYSRFLPRGSYVKFNVNGLLRGDGKARWEQHQIALQNKVMTRDEVRGLEDMNPLGGEDGGLLETPNNNAPDQSPAPEETNSMTPTELALVLRAIGDKAPETHLHLPEQVRLDVPPLDIPPTTVNFDNETLVAALRELVQGVKDIPAPQVNVDVAPTPVTIENHPPEVRAAPPPLGPTEVVVTQMPKRAHSVSRNDKGVVIGSVEVDV